MLRIKSLAKSCPILFCIAGVTDLERNYTLRPELRKLHSKLFNVDNNTGLTNRSSILWVGKLKKQVPIMLIHGTNDDRVSPLDSIEMAGKLYKGKILFELHCYQGDDHLLANNYLDYMMRIKKWIN
jgi:dipeptidyl aminopeptidase/acylaminoacyl peptidase